MKLQELIQKIALKREEEFPLPDDLEAYLDDFVPNTLLKSETFQKAFGISSFEMEELYQEGYDAYQKEIYSDSSLIFRFLVLLNPFVEKYWFGLGASQYLLGAHEKALHAYGVAALLNGDNPQPHEAAHACYQALHNPEEAQKALSLAQARM